MLSFILSQCLDVLKACVIILIGVMAVLVFALTELSDVLQSIE